MKLPVSQLKKIIREEILATGHFDLDLCKIGVADVSDLRLSTSAHTARISALLTLSDPCPLGPTSAAIEVALAPKVDKGGILRANLGAVSLKLEGGLGPFFDNHATAKLSSQLQNAIGKFVWLPPKTEFGSFALQGARVEAIDEETAEFTILVDGIMTSAQATKLIQNLLPSKPLIIAQ